MEQLQTMSIESPSAGEFELLSEGNPERKEAERFLERFREKMRRKMGTSWKPFPWKSLSVRNALIAACAVVILLAAYLNLRFTPTQGKAEGEQQLFSDTAAPSMEEEDYFAIAVINRTRARDEAIDMYQALAEDETATQTTRQEAYASMNALVDRTASEVDIENRIRAKGFSNCVVVLEDNRANVIVETDGLTDGEVAQITEIVYLQAGVIPQNLTITESV